MQLIGRGMRSYQGTSKTRAAFTLSSRHFQNDVGVLWLDRAPQAAEFQPKLNEEVFRCGLCSPFCLYIYLPTYLPTYLHPPATT